MFLDSIRRANSPTPGICAGGRIYLDADHGRPCSASPSMAVARLFESVRLALTPAIWISRILFSNGPPSIDAIRLSPRPYDKRRAKVYDRILPLPQTSWYYIQASIPPDSTVESGTKVHDRNSFTNSLSANITTPRFSRSLSTEGSYPHTIHITADPSA
jgi:hypothetical protein